MALARGGEKRRNSCVAGRCRPGPVQVMTLVFEVAPSRHVQAGGKIEQWLLFLLKPVDGKRRTQDWCTLAELVVGASRLIRPGERVLEAKET